MKRVISRLIFFILSGLCINLPAAAQKDKEKKIKVDSIPVIGEVFDRLTTRHVVSTNVQVLSHDSTPISSTEGGGVYYTYNNNKIIKDSTSSYKIYIPRRSGDYIIKVSKEGYQDILVPYRAEIGKRVSELKAPKIYMSREMVHQLEELTVKSSKIKFYHKGDTLVYNPEAFILPEGSMLDALVSQLPGVEIKGNEIYVNGKFVESLLLNGKDFFKGDKSVAMQNIGAYAVKDVAVYEKKDEMGNVLGDRDDVSEQLVMDVRLKKDYMTGTALNVDAGYGTNGRYLGRIFGLAYTNNSRVSIYGNVNNINKNNNLDENGETWVRALRTGINELAKGGVDYMVDNAAHTWELTGNAEVRHVNATEESTKFSQQFLQNASNYLTSYSNDLSKTLSVSTLHDLKIKRENWNLNLAPSFNYNHGKERSEKTSATLNDDFGDLSQEEIKNLFQSSYHNLSEALVNRNLEWLNNRRHGYNGELAAASKIKLPGSPDAIELKGNIQYERASANAATLQDICFGDNGEGGGFPALSQLQQRNSVSDPDRRFRVLGLGRYYFTLPAGSLNFSYEFIHTQKRDNKALTLLEAVAQGSLAEFTPGQLPVEDPANSFTSMSYKNQHHLKLIWRWKKKYSKGELSLGTAPGYFIERHDLFYQQDGISVDPRRTFGRLKIEDTYIQWRSPKKQLNVYLSYSFNQETPNLLNMVDIPNTTDPLNIRLGNPDLKLQATNRVSFHLNVKSSSRVAHFLYGSFNIKNNAFVNGYRYDSATGVRTSRMYNVSGTKDFYANYDVNIQLDKAGDFNLRPDVYFNYDIYANMIGYDADPTPQKVKSIGFDSSLELSMQKKVVDASLALFSAFAKMKTHAEQIKRESYANLDLDASVNVRLPFNLSAGTDFAMLNYCGYGDRKPMYLWNANLKYSTLKGALTFTLEGKDLLNNGTNYGMTVSANEITRNYAMALGRYAMLTIGYKFHLKPKRAKK